MSQNGYRGPWLMVTPQETARILDALHGHTDDLAKTICSKCAVVLEADPRLREPMK